MAAVSCGASRESNEGSRYSARDLISGVDLVPVDPDRIVRSATLVEAEDVPNALGQISASDERTLLVESTDGFDAVVLYRGVFCGITPVLSARKESGLVVLEAEVFLQGGDCDAIGFIHAIGVIFEDEAKSMSVRLTSVKY